MDKNKVLSDAKLWIKQEKVWDDTLFASAAAGQSGGSPERRRVEEKPLMKENLSPTLRQADAPANRLSGKGAALAALYDRFKGCVACALGHSRIKIVFGVGNPESKVLFIGEGPGYEEDRRGEPFVGKAGILLDKMMAAIQLSRQTNAYIANIVKCHPMANPKTPDARGNDRPPEPEEVDTCAPILLQQIAIIQPLAIMTLGSPSTKMMLHTKDAITGLRGKLVPFDVDYFYSGECYKGVEISAETRAALSKTRILPTFHPAALLRNPNLKKDSWEDLKLLRKVLDGQA